MRYVHGMHKTKAYRIWANAKTRCHNPKHRDFPSYGGRGIYMCEEWRLSFSSFFRDMGEPGDAHSLDRIDNNGPYSPENCRWATAKEQQRNKRVNHVLVAWGQARLLCEWCDLYGLKSYIIIRRLQRGWTAEQAISGMGPYIPYYMWRGRMLQLHDIAAEVGISPATLRYRINRGASLEQAVAHKLHAVVRAGDG